MLDPHLQAQGDKIYHTHKRHQNIRVIRTEAQLKSESKAACCAWRGHFQYKYPKEEKP